MAGYVRQSAASIVTGADILAAPLNAEFNQIQAAMNATTGHGHTGGTGDGPKIVLTAAAGISGTLPVANGGTGSTTAAAARTALGLVPGTDVQAYDPDLAAIAGLTSAANKGITFTGAGTAATYDLTAYALTLLDDANASTALSTLGVSTFAKTILDDPDAATVRATIGVSVGGGGGDAQPLDATLTAMAGVTTASNKMIYFTGVDAATSADLTTFARTLLDDSDALTMRSTLGLIIGTDVEAKDADLTALAGNSTNGLWTRTGSGTGSARTITGTANEITLTNGDGVSGNPTVSLPTALTFTGKTVTNGSYTSPTITGSPTSSSATWTSLGTVTTIDINGGTIDGTIIGGSSTAAGSFTTVTASGNITGNSDIRLKQDIKPIKDALRKLLQIEGIEYTRTSDGTRNVGVSAQAVQNVFPEMVRKDNTDYLSVDYGSGLGPVIEALREINERLKKLEGK